MYLSTQGEQKAELLTMKQACECTSLGKTKLREIASVKSFIFSIDA